MWTKRKQLELAKSVIKPYREQEQQSTIERKGIFSYYIFVTVINLLKQSHRFPGDLAVALNHHHDRSDSLTLFEFGLPVMRYVNFYFGLDFSNQQIFILSQIRHPYLRRLLTGKKKSKGKNQSVSIGVTIHQETPRALGLHQRKHQKLIDKFVSFS